ncbi:MAG: DUF6057 family protein [Mangrovibacterium sp.]
MRTTIKPEIKMNQQKIFCWLTFISIWIFWSFFYKYNLYFQEQLQLFLLTGDYFLKSISTPGGFSGYTGEFLTQFYLVPFAGASIITLLLLALYQLTRKLLLGIGNHSAIPLLSLLPPVWYCFILTDEFYLLSGLIGVNLAMAFSLIYISVNKRIIRLWSGLLLIPFVYFLTGGSYLLFFLVILLYERLSHRQKPMPVIVMFLFLLVAVAIPLLVKKYYFATPHLQAFVSNHYYKISTDIPFPVVLIWLGIPLLMTAVRLQTAHIPGRLSWKGLIFQVILVLITAFSGFRLFSNISSEHVKAFDYYVRQGKWDQVISLANKNMPRNTFAVNYLNLALAKTGQLGDRMFQYPQAGSDGLFLPYKREHLSSMLGNEVFYQIGLVNVSQQYIFESMEATPDLRKTVRAVRRLAETNLINGQYEVAAKYIHKLKQTLFYRKWAKETETFLYDEEKIDNHPDWGEKRRIRPVQDYFFSIDHMDQILLSVLHDHPDNRMAFEYLMTGYLVKKDLKSFMNYLPHAREMGYISLPEFFQEAVLYVLGLYSQTPENDSPFPISNRTIQRLHEYAAIYTNNPNAGKLLKKNFENTYWYYFHFR